jgi:hypothetical protein
MEYASEMVVQATLHKLKICEVPTTLKKDGRDRPPHLRSWSDGWRHLTFLLMHSPNWLFLYPGAILWIVGLIVSFAIMIHPIEIGSVKFSVNTMLYAAIAAIIGFQLILYYVLTKKYASITGFIPMTDIDRSLVRFTMNKGIFIGALLFVVGTIGSIVALAIWSSYHFGDLIPEDILRLTIPMLILLVSGIQLMFSSFFLGILEIKIKRNLK